MIWSRRQASDQIVQATHLSTPHPKLNLVSNSLLLGQFWPFLRNFKHSTAVLKATNQLFGYVGWQGVPFWYQKMTKAWFWNNSNQNIKSKWTKKWWKMANNETLIWVNFLLFKGLLKATNQLLWYVRWSEVSQWYQEIIKTIF